MIEPIVDCEWLVENRTDVVVADVRWYLDGPPGRDAYLRGHIPGAVFVGLDEVLSAPADPVHGRHPLPSAQRFAEALGQIGIGDEDTVIGYDDQGGVIAARLVWMLRTLGRPAALLDGGLAAWPGPLETDATVRPRSRFTARPWPADGVASIEEVAVLASGAGRRESQGDAHDTILIDARDRSRYAGGPDPVDPRSGHIPGAVSLPARENLAADGRTLCAAELRRRFAAVGVTPGAPVIAYCGSGVTACFDLLAVEQVGLGPGRLYAGSWSQWSRERARPIATGASP
jgi:thiosulfate/3-mercaptopyruvate sulfurtransferase